MAVRWLEPGEQGADHLGVTPTLADFYDAHDLSFSVRYCEPTVSSRWGEDIDQAEIGWHADTGRGVLLNWERTTDEALEGPATGRRVGMFMREMALGLQYPVECPLFFSVDFPVVETHEEERVLETLAAFRDAIHPWPLGVYGNTRILRAVRDQGWEYYGWRAAAESWGAAEPGLQHIQQHVPELDGTIDRNTVEMPVPCWFPESDVWPLMFPFGYGTRHATWAEIGWIVRFDLAEPAFLSILRELMYSRNGRLGVGSGIRSRDGQQPSAASLAGRSFHQMQKYEDGTEWWSAVDAVAADPAGGNHTVPPPGLIPRQGEDEAILRGVHLNVDNPSGGTSSHLVHTQHIGQDGYGTWDAAGRPRLTVWPAPIEGPVPPSAVLDPYEPPTEEEDAMRQVLLIRIPQVGVFDWETGAPATQASLPVMLAPRDQGGMGAVMVTETDPEAVWAFMGFVLGQMDPGAADRMRRRYNAQTPNEDIPEITIPIEAPAPPNVEVSVEIPPDLAVRVAEMPDQNHPLVVRMDGKVDID